jgi:hypothetical protein
VSGWNPDSPWTRIPGMEDRAYGDYARPSTQNREKLLAIYEPWWLKKSQECRLYWFPHDVCSCGSKFNLKQAVPFRVLESDEPSVDVIGKQLGCYYRVYSRSYRYEVKCFRCRRKSI